MKKIAKYKLAEPNRDLQCPICHDATLPSQTRLAQLTAFGKNNFYFGKNNYLKEAKEGLFNDWSCRSCEEKGLAIFPDFKKQEFGLGGPIYLYINKIYVCNTCKTDFDFTPLEQQHWFENLGFNSNAYPKNCLSCRKKIRTPKVLAKRLSELLKEKPGSVETFEEIASIYNKLGLEEKGRLFNARARNLERR